MWGPVQRDRFVDLTGIYHAPRCTLQRVRSALMKINRLMTVVTTALFARRLEQDYIDRVTEQRARDQDQRPVPTPKGFERGFIIREYERISRLGKKTRPASGEVPVTMEDAPGPRDSRDRLALPNDEDLDQHREELRWPLNDCDPEPEDELQGLPDAAHTADSADVAGRFINLPVNLASDTT